MIVALLTSLFLLCAAVATGQVNAVSVNASSTNLITYDPTKETVLSYKEYITTVSIKDFELPSRSSASNLTQTPEFRDLTIKGDGLQATLVNLSIEIAEKGAKYYTRMLVVADEEFRNTHLDWMAETEKLIESIDDYFIEKFGVDFQIVGYAEYISDDSLKNPHDLFWDVKKKVNKNLWNANVMLVFCGQYKGILGGLAEKPGDDAIIFKFKDYVIQHELSHFFNAPDHNPGLDKFCIMSYSWNDITHNWCDECTEIMESYLNERKTGNLYAIAKTDEKESPVFELMTHKEYFVFVDGWVETQDGKWKIESVLLFYDKALDIRKGDKLEGYVAYHPWAGFIDGKSPYWVSKTVTARPIPTITPEPSVTQFVITTWAWDSGGHLYIKDLPSAVTVGETYPITLTLSFEWSDASDTVIEINGIYVGFVSEENIRRFGEDLKVLLISDCPDQKVEADWIGFDYIAVNKEVRIGDSITITAYITPQKPAKSNKVYLMFDLEGSAESGIPPSTYVICGSFIHAPSTVEVEISSQAKTPTPAPERELEELKISIEPKFLEAKPGDIINYNITLDWSPSDWRKEMKITAVLTAAGFEKRYELPEVKPTSNPPITNQITFQVPDVPPLTYKLRLEVEADSLKASDVTELRLKMQIPGFEFVAGFIAMSTVIAFRLRRLLKGE